MSHLAISELLKGNVAVDSQVTIKGWIRTRRDSKAGISFLAVHDGSCFDPIQAVVPNSLNNYDEVTSLTAGCSVSVTGVLVQSAGKGQSFEIQANTVTVLGWVENPDSYPMSAKRHSIEYLREHAHLRPRTNMIGAVTRVRNCLAQAIHRFYHEQGYYWISTPIITASDCEGAGEMFRVSTLDMQNLPRTDKGDVDYSEDFFGKEAFLTVSGQLNGETYASAMSKIYTFGPTFRAENSNTSRHLAEFWMVEPEMAFYNLDDDMDLAEEFLEYIVKSVLEHNMSDLEILERDVTKLQKIERPFPRVSYDEAVQMLKDEGHEFEWGNDLGAADETIISSKFDKPVMVHRYPAAIKAFYMKRDEKDNNYVKGVDLLAPEGYGEIIGGSERETSLEKLLERIAAEGLDKEDYSWYLELRKFGSVPHSGFGLGLERLVTWVCKLQHIREAIPFPRTSQRLRP